MAKKKDRTPDETERFDWKDEKEFLEDEIGEQEFKHNLLHNEDGNPVEKYEIDEDWEAEQEEKEVLDGNLKSPENPNYHGEDFHADVDHHVIIGSGVPKEAEDLERELKEDGVSISDIRKLKIKDENPEDEDPVLIKENWKDVKDYNKEYTGEILELFNPIEFVLDEIYDALKYVCESEEDAFKLELLKDGVTYEDFVRSIQFRDKEDDEDDFSYLINSLASMADSETLDMPILIETKKAEKKEPEDFMKYFMKNMLFAVAEALTLAAEQQKKAETDYEQLGKPDQIYLSMTFEIKTNDPKQKTDLTERLKDMSESLGPGWNFEVQDITYIEKIDKLDKLENLERLNLPDNLNKEKYEEEEFEKELEKSLKDMMKNHDATYGLNDIEKNYVENSKQTELGDFYLNKIKNLEKEYISPDELDSEKSEQAKEFSKIIKELEKDRKSPYKKLPYERQNLDNVVNKYLEKNSKKKDKKKKDDDDDEFYAIS